ncbi:TDP-N-acetylfucosamine:lipid II N-acetylfucosaminyltransferase [Pseudidiomarina insulisalsae]|uniref:4-alpha-L-fucosyltransferase n=1 Tax=Pseudidiomarina insulisalsae TaxID=575789 RepID=A0A432YNU8_9GAMM|nr:TDP-N-acetylfucosamine:lipid II N-acetylfucosaminyltransferase [Pseudidiomarina insulisalsae]RUO62626.1 hypothetical protein CWI71_04125 [Pseudidiomarina insulisalsae]
MSKPIVHVGRYDKFMSPFINFVNKHFAQQRHLFFLFVVSYSHELNDSGNVHLHSNKRGLLKTLVFNLQTAWKMQRAERIILHGLFNNSVVAILFFMPWLLKKSYWLVWGGDVYYRPSGNQLPLKIKFMRMMRRRVIRQMGYIVTSVKGDYEKAVEWHGTRSPNLPYFMYTNSLYQYVAPPERNTAKTRILLGNSAMRSNHHEQAMDIIAPYVNDAVEIICPLNYGDLEYGKEMAKLGEQRFGRAFRPILDYMPYDEYMQILSTVDIAVFNHDRQQAMSSTRVLLGMGTRVYLRKETTSYANLTGLGAKLHAIENFCLALDPQESAHNIGIIKTHYSEERLRANMAKIFGSEKALSS